VCEQNISELSYKWILMTCFGEMGRGPRTSRLDFGGDPDSFVDHESFSRILYR